MVTARFVDRYYRHKFISKGRPEMARLLVEISDLCLFAVVQN